MSSPVWDRIAYITKLLKEKNFSISLKEYKIIRRKLFWIRINAFKGSIRIVITEVWRENSRIKYSYTLIISDSDQITLRYDNAPHHRHIRTFPDHKHVYNDVLELEDSSFESFLNEAISIFKRTSKTS